MAARLRRVLRDPQSSRRECVAVVTREDGYYVGVHSARLFGTTGQLWKEDRELSRSVGLSIPHQAPRVKVLRVRRREQARRLGPP